MQIDGYSLATCASACALVIARLLITQSTRDPHELPAATLLYEKEYEHGGIGAVGGAAGGPSRIVNTHASAWLVELTADVRCEVSSRYVP